MRYTCEECGVNCAPGHICTKYDGPPCEVCGAGTVFVSVAAPGTGCGYSCRNGHFVGECRDLTLAEVI